jgi:hypothetical protein
VTSSYVPRLVIVDSNSASPAAEKPGDAEVRAWLDKDGNVVGHAFARDGTHVIELDGVARFTVNAGSAEVTALPSSGVTEDLAAEYFRRWILPVAVHVGGLEVLHASAVVSPTGVVAFAAASEAGKSTLAYGLADRGYGTWTDDALAFDVLAGTPHAFPLPFRLRLRPASATHFGLEPATGGTIAGASEAAGDPEPISTVFLLERKPSGPPVEIESIDPLEAFPRLVERSYHFGAEESERKRAMLSRYLELATAVPVYQLSMATGLENLSAVLHAVEGSL